MKKIPLINKKKNYQYDINFQSNYQRKKAKYAL